MCGLPSPRALSFHFPPLLVQLQDEAAVARSASIQHLVQRLQEAGGVGGDAGSGQRLVRAAGKVLTQAKADAQSAARSLNQAIKKLA